MSEQKADLYILTNAKYFESHLLPLLQENLKNADDKTWSAILILNLKDPLIMLIISFLGGAFGVDRFMIGDIGLGIAKLLTCGGFGFWFVIDLFLIMDATKKRNKHLLSQIPGLDIRYER